MNYKEIDCALTHKFDEYPSFGVLEGVNVLVTGTNIAGPFAGQIMAEMGAKVIHSESPKVPCNTRGCTAYSQNHRNEYAITVNPWTPAGKKIFKKLLQWADIWVESSKAGTYARHGYTDDFCWGLNEKLCIVHVSGYGQTGPYKGKPSYDVSGQAMSGYMYMNGESPTSPPLKVNPYLSDYVTAYNACIAGIASYVHCLKTGKGESADVSQYETMFRILDNYPSLWYNSGYPKHGEPVPYRTGNKSDLAACFSFYKTKDNKQLFVGITGRGPVEKGYPIIGAGVPGTVPDIPKDAAGFPLSAPVGKRVDDLCAKFCAEHTCEELEEIFNEVGIPNQRAYDPGDIANDPQFAARENIVEWEDEIFGPMKGIGITNRFKNNPSRIVSSAPCYGEHNREVLKSFGYTDEEIDKLYEKGELRTWTPADTSKHWHLHDWGFFWDVERQCERIGITPDAKPDEGAED